MSKPEQDGDDSGHSAKLLKLIAETLDCPVSTFYDRKTRDEDHTLELLRLWFQIEEDQDRLKVLGMLRTLSKSSVDQRSNFSR